ncbi:hypothetical protein B0H19DRAFT_1086232 [Mycena capillaripes]|nr:hypothetical protein B0H19DRAFT_1086232 [Mycena capillaripes]
MPATLTSRTKARQTRFEDSKFLRSHSLIAPLGWISAGLERVRASSSASVRRPKTRMGAEVGVKGERWKEKYVVVTKASINIGRFSQTFFAQFVCHASQGPKLRKISNQSRVIEGIFECAKKVTKSAKMLPKITFFRALRVLLQDTEFDAVGPAWWIYENPSSNLPVTGHSRGESSETVQGEDESDREGVRKMSCEAETHESMSLPFADLLKPSSHVRDKDGSVALQYSAAFFPPCRSIHTASTASTDLGKFSRARPRVYARKEIWYTVRCSIVAVHSWIVLHRGDVPMSTMALCSTV